MTADRGPVTVDLDALAAERLAAFFHATYERLAPEFGYTPRAETSVPWEDVPADNKALMTAVAAEVIANGPEARAAAEYRQAVSDWVTARSAEEIEAAEMALLVAHERHGAP